MKGSYIEVLATHGGPAHALVTREGAAKRWVRGARRPAIEPRNRDRLGCRRGRIQRKATPVTALSRAVIGSRGVGEPVACVRSPHAENREGPRSPACGDGRAGRAGKAKAVIP
jgi:hypothetical protein